MQDATNQESELVCVSPCCTNWTKHTVLYAHCSDNSHCGIAALTYHHLWQFHDDQLGRFIVVPQFFPEGTESRACTGLYSEVWGGGGIRNKVEKLPATAVHIFPFQPWRRHQCTTVGKAKILQRVYPVYVAKSRINRILRLALNGVKYDSVRLKIVAKVAAATAIAASEERKECQIGESGERNVGCSA